MEAKKGVPLAAKGKTLWVETPKGKSLLREIDFGLEEEGYLKRINEFYLHSYHLFLLFFIFYGCISPLHELNFFSRVLM